MLAHAITDIGKVRETNEDSFVCTPPLFVVADGMGGHVAGEIASRLAAATLASYIATHSGVLELELLLKQAINQANSAVFQLAHEKSDYAGMGTTLTAVYADNSQIVWGHVGDSRIYLLRGGNLIQITEDHSLVGELIRCGTITPEEAMTHPQRNILTRAVGTGETVKVDTGVIDWLTGDQLLLCTDGLTNLVSAQEICQEITARTAVDEEVLVRLVAMANDRGGIDNITAILVKKGES